MLDRLEDSEAMIEDLANMMDDVNASLIAGAELTNITSGQASYIEAITGALGNLTAAVENNTQRLDVVEDEFDSYQAATDNALMTMQGSLCPSQNCTDKMDAVMKALNETSERLSELEEQGAELTRNVDGIVSQVTTLPALQASMSNMTQEIKNVDTRLSSVEQIISDQEAQRTRGSNR
jgi:chromosome segregation ATPase